ADGYVAADAGNTEARMFRHVGKLCRADAAFARRCGNRLGERMPRIGSERGSEREGLRRDRLGIGEDGLTGSERPGLVEHDGVDLCQFLERGAVLEKDAAAEEPSR